MKQWQNVGGTNLLNSFYSSPERWGFSFELYSMLTKIEALLNIANTDKQIIIVERSILSDRVFIDLSYELGKMNDMEYAMINNIYTFFYENLYPKLEGIIYLDTPVDICLKRIIQRKRAEENGIEINYLEALKEKMELICNNFKNNVIRIDSSQNFIKNQKKICNSFMIQINKN